MASIFTGLAFMHGHIVDRELVLRLGREDSVRTRTAQGTATVQRDERREAPRQVPTRPACVAC